MSNPTDSAERDATLLAPVLHASGTCDAMFSHYGPAKKCERIARELVDSPEFDRIVADYERTVETIWSAADRYRLAWLSARRRATRGGDA